MISLDNAATTKPWAEAAARAIDVMNKQWGNPSSIHTMERTVPGFSGRVP